MLSRFHAIKRVNAQFSLPQSESVEDEGFVQRGYVMALDMLLVGVTNLVNIHTSCACTDSSPRYEELSSEIKIESASDRTQHS